MRTCRRCGESDPTAFTQHGSYCKPCVKIDNDRYYAKHKERLKATGRLRSAQWSRDNPERKRQQNIDRYASRTPEDRAEHNHAARMYRSGLPVQHSGKDWLRVLAIHGAACAYCGRPGSHRDHVIPLSRGGTDFIGNIVPACASCNSSKRNQTIMEWRVNPRCVSPWLRQPTP